MRDLDPSVAAGSYAKKQLLTRSGIIAWSHRRRLETGLRLARRLQGRQVIDYGCGDGTFLALLMQGDGPPTRAVGAEIDAALVHDCRRRLERAPELTFLHVDDLDAREHQNAYDLVVCMEVLEHVVGPEATIGQLRRLASDGGHILISVPVETGVAVLMKQAGRRIADWLGFADYPGSMPYQWWELLLALRPGNRQYIARPVHRAADGRLWHDHKGFNWRLLLRMLESSFRVEELHTSPIPGVPPGMASQVWFLGHPR